MDVLKGRRDVHRRVAEWKARGLRVGFVPTMGALHEGHLALIDTARAACDRVVASIFVNPLQFGPNEDFARYPRPVERDTELLSARGCDALFLPDVAEMYPTSADTVVSQRLATEHLCGAWRPGHFTGVLTVVLKLLMQVAPHDIFLGRKDFQQVVVLTRMVRDLDLDLDIRVHACPTIREADGLAMSSRNAYLSPSDRATAPAVKRALDAVSAAWAAGVRSTAELEAAGVAVLDRAGGFKIQYLSVVDAATCVPRRATGTSPEETDVVAVAAVLGATRLIDNVDIKAC
jgi:pantoate--beta-alanine ligase